MVGDRVIVTERYSTNRIVVGTEGTLVKIELGSTAEYLVFVETRDGVKYESWCKGVRLINHNPWDGSILRFKFR